MRSGNLEERELHLAELCAQLNGMSALADGDVLDEIPNVVVFLGGAPLRAAKAGVAAGVDVHQATVACIGRGGVVTTDAKLFVKIGIRIRADARCYQARKAGAGFRNDGGIPHAGVADLRVAVQIDFANAGEAAVVESAGEGSNQGLAGIAPAD